MSLNQQWKATLAEFMSKHGDVFREYAKLCEQAKAQGQTFTNFVVTDDKRAFAIDAVKIPIKQEAEIA